MSFKPIPSLSGDNASFVGDVFGTGDGNRITNDGIPYLISGDSPAENDTLQDVTTRGNETTTSIISTGPYISGVTGLFSNQVGIGTTSPLEELHVVGNALITDGVMPNLGNYAFGFGRHSGGPSVYGGMYGNGLYRYLTLRGANGIKFFVNNHAGDSVFTIDGDLGNVGIGTTSPAARLHVQSSGSDGIIVRTSTNVEPFIALQRNTGSNGVAVLRSIDGGHLRIDTGATGAAQSTKMSVLAGGNVGIGTTNPSAKLDVRYDSSKDGIFLKDEAGGAVMLFGADGSNNARARFYNGLHSQNIEINSNTGSPTYFNAGNVGIGTANPTAQLQSVAPDGSKSSLRLGRSDTSIFWDFNHAGGDLRIWNSAASGSDILLGVDAGGTVKNNKVGIGTASPTAKLHVQGTSFFFDQAIFDDKVGIGTTSPAYKLDVNGDINIPLGSNYLRFGGQLGIKKVSNGAMHFYAGTNSTTGGFDFATWNGSYNEGSFVIRNNGNVGIGTTGPTSPLTIKSNSVSSNDSALTIQGNSNTNAIVKIAEKSTDGARFHMYDGGVEKIAFYTDGTANHISAGNVGIGTTAPSSKLHVGDGTADDFIKVFFSDNTNLDIHGYGIEFNRIYSYLRPTTNNNKNLEIGTNSRNWNRISMYSSDDFLFYNATTELVRITQDGKVGIGTTSPNSILELASQNPVINFKDTNAGTDLSYRYIQNVDGKFLFAKANDAYNSFTTHMAIDTDGNVGIGTASPNELLHVEDSSSSSGTSIAIQNAFGESPKNIKFRYNNTVETARIEGFGRNSTSNLPYLAFHVNQTTSSLASNDVAERMRIDSSGNVGIGTTSPSAALTIKGSANDSTFRLNSFSGSGYIDALMGNTPYFRLYQSTGNRLQIGAGDGNINRFNSSNTAIDLSFATNGGNVGIGTTSPAAKLHVYNSAGGDATDKAGMLSEAVMKLQPHASNSTNMLFAQVNSGDGMGIQVTNGAATANWDIALSPFGGNVGIGTTAPATILDIDDGTLSDIRIRGNATTDVRFAGIAFYNTAGSDVVAAVNVDRDGANDAGALTFDTQPAGGGNTERLRISSTGAIKFNNYGAGTFTGTVTQKLGVDSSGNVIEMPIGAGPVDGSGTANYLARWIDSDTLGIGAAYDNGTNVGIGTTIPSKKLEVDVGGTSSDGILVVGSLNPHIEAKDSTNSVRTAIASEDSLGKVGTISSTDLKIVTSNSERIRVDTSGNVGIGTTSPDSKLHIDSTGEALRFTRDAQETYRLIHGTSGLYFTRPNSASLAFGVTQNSDFDIFDTSANVMFKADASTGNVGIGTTSPIADLHVNGDVQIGSSTQPNSYGALQVNQTSNVDEEGIGVLSASAGRSIRIWVDETRSYINSGNGGSGILVLNEGAGNVGIGTTSPAEKLEVVGQAIIDGGVGVNSAGTLHLRQKGNTSSDGIAITSANATSHRIWKDVNGKLNIGPSTLPSSFVQDLSGNVGIGTTTPSYKLDVNGTLRATSAAYFNNDVVVTNNLILTGANKPTFSTPDDTVYTPSNNWVTATPFNAAWHDLIAFDRNYTTAQEISTDGTNFSSDTLELGLFDQKDKTKYEVVGSGERAVRWTWTGVAYSVGRYFHIAAGYSSPAPSCTVKIETSSDGSTWTEIHSSSGISFSATNRFYYVDPYIGNGGHNYVRLTIDKGNTDTKTINLTSIKMLTQRLGDQGKGREDELPFYYDKNQNIGIGTNSPDNKLEVVGPYSATPFKVLRHGDYGNVIQIGRNGVSETANIGYPADSTINLSTAGSERLRIDSSGNVGIGTTDPQNLLHVHKSNTTGPTIELSNSEYRVYVNSWGSTASTGRRDRFEINASATDFAVAGDSIRFQIGSAGDSYEKMRITSAGNVGIGTTNPTEKLEVAPDSDVSAIIGRAHIGKAAPNDFATFSHVDHASSTNYALNQNQHGDTKLNYANGRSLSFRRTNVEIGGFNASADFFVDTDTLYVDSSTDRVGIGTTSPNSPLQVYGNAKFGASPSANVTAGSSGLTLNAGANQINFTNANAEIYSAGYLSIDIDQNNNQTDEYFAITQNNGANELFRIKADGNVGIGTTNPSAKLHVQGSSATDVPIIRVGGFGNSGSTLELAETLSNGDMTYGFSFFNDGNSSNTLQLKRHQNSAAGATIVTFNRTDNNVSFAGGLTIALKATSSSTLSTDSGTTLATKNYVDAQVGSADTLQEVTDNGNTTTNSVGIGTTSPSGLLQVGKYTVAAQGNQNTYGNLSSFANSNTDNIFLGLKNGSYPNRGYAFKVTSNGVNSDFTIKEHGLSGDRFTIQTGGNVGIGTTNPSSILEVVDASTSATNRGIIIRNTSSSNDPDFRIGVGYSGMYDDALTIFKDSTILQYLTHQGTFFTQEIGIATSKQIKAFNSGLAYLDIYNGSANTELSASTDLIFKTTGAERVRIKTSSGNVGIGTTNPSSKLEVVEATANTAARITVDSASWDASLSLKNANGTWEILNDYTGAGTTGALAFWNGSYRMVIDNTGNVGIGTTSPSRKFEVHEGNVYLKVGAQSGYTDGYGPILTTNSNSIVAPERVYLAASQAYIRRENIGGQGLTLHGDTFSRFTYYNGSSTVEALRIDNSGNVGIGTTAPCAKLEVNGHFAATSKSFIIDHPTKEDKKLQYASLEGPENGVYVRGTTDKETIELPEYWSELVHEDSITVVLTPIGKKQDLFIIEKSNKLIKIGGAEGSFDYVVYGERKDIDKLEIEPLKV